MNISVSDVKQACLKKWCNGDKNLDQRLQDFNENFEIWYEQIPLCNRTTVITLIEHLEYYSHRATNAWLKDLHDRLLACQDVSDENTIYVFLKSKDGTTNSSNDYWTEYKAINNLNKYVCIENMDVLDPEDWECIKNIVFVDDFSGTGDTFISELKKNPMRYSNKRVYFITINTMVCAAERIEQYCKENNISVTLLSIFNQEKAFESDLFVDNEGAKNEIRQMSKDFLIPQKAILGHKKSQAIVVFYNNTPNNTLGFIRYSTDKYKSLFPRKDDRAPTWAQMKKQRWRRRAANYKNILEGSKNE